MNFDKLSIKNTQPIIDFVKRYRFILFFVLFAGLYLYLMFTINQLTTATPSQSEVDSELKTVKRLRVDEDAVDSMLRLEEENIEVKGLFEEARNNPFAE